MAEGFDAARYAAFLMASLPGLAAAPEARGRLGCLDAALDRARARARAWSSASIAGAPAPCGAPPALAPFPWLDSLVGFPRMAARCKKDFRGPAPAPPARQLRLPRRLLRGERCRASSPRPARIAVLTHDCDIHASAQPGLTALAPLSRRRRAASRRRRNYGHLAVQRDAGAVPLLTRSASTYARSRAGPAARPAGDRLRFPEAAAIPLGRRPRGRYGRPAAGVLVPRMADWPAPPAGIADRLAARAAAHHGRTQRRADCHPDDPAAPPPPARPAWRRWLGLR